MSAEELATGGSRSAVTSAPGAARSGYSSSRSEPLTSTVITAEIPAVPIGPKYGVLLPDGTIWYPGSRRKLPAPLPLRVIVWALAFLVLLAGAALFIIHTHPAWFDPLKRKVPANAASLSINTARRHHGGTRPASPGPTLSLENPQPSPLPASTAAYAIRGTSHYVISVATTQWTYVQAYQLVNGEEYGPALYAGEVAAGTTQLITASGPVQLQVAAAGTTVSVLSGGKSIGTVATPPYVPWNYWFEPSGT